MNPSATAKRGEIPLKKTSKRRVLMSFIFRSNRVFQLTLLSMFASLLAILSPITTAPAEAADVDTSSVGTQFDFALPVVYTDAGSNHPFSGWKLFFSSSSRGTATVTWPDNTTTTVDLIAGGVASQEVASGFRVGTVNGVASNKVISVTSTTPISMYGCNLAEAASDCTNFFPTSTFGTRYRLSYGPQGKILVFSGNSSATLTFVPKVTLNAGRTFTAGQSYTIELAPKQVWAIDPGEDFTGSLITSTAPVGVLNGWNCSGAYAVFPNGGGACDSGAQVVPPVSSWGTEFYSVNYRNSGDTGSSYRIVADQNNTVVRIRGDESATVTLQAGADYKLEAFRGTGSGAQPNKSISISSNNPILVSHWFLAGNYTSIEGTDTGDMSMSYVTPFQQFMNSYIVANPSGFKGSFINLVVPSAVASTIKLDGNTIDQSLFRTIAGSSWKSAQLQVRQGTHVVSASQAFGIEVYGIGFYDSYAYTGGQNTADVANVSQLQIQTANVNGVVGQQVCVPVQVLDASGVPVPGIRLDASISGVSGSTATTASSDSSGTARICYTGTAVGADTITISSNGFVSTATVNWAIALPDISYSPNTISLAVNAVMPALRPTNLGGKATTWSVNPSLPTGLTLNTSTGVITGLPTVETTTTAYTITASNSSGDDSTDINLSVVPAQIPTISYSPTTFTFTLDQPITKLVPTTNGTFPVWSVSPSLPSGLTLNSQDGSISGTPTRETTSRTYSVSASNSAGSVSTSLTIAVVPTPPNLSYSPQARTVYVGYPIQSISPLNSGSPATTWSITPALSAGLSFDSTKGSIFGTPTGTAVAETPYEVTATNSAGTSRATVRITVSTTPPAPDISYNPGSVSAVVGSTINALTATNIGGPASTWTISPALPAGFSFSETTGRITGTPTATLSSTTYTITATNNSNVSDNTTITLAVANPPAPDISYQNSLYTFTKGKLIDPMNAINLGGPAASWSISPSIPSGFIFDTGIGQISGTPAAASAETYTVTAINGGGTDTYQVRIEVVIPPAPDITYSPTSIVAYQYSAIYPLLPTNVGGEVSTWTIAPALPSGLSLNSVTGEISGSPLGTQNATNYVVTATNGGGTDTASVTIRINAEIVAPPNIDYPTNSLSATTTIAISPLTPTNTGARATWTIAPSLPAGLTINSSSGVISGTPTAASPLTSYTVTATNGGGSDSATVTITVTPISPPNIDYPNRTLDALTNVAITTLTPTNSGGPATSWSISPALPTGLSFNTSTGVISGTPTAASASRTYTVTASNSTGPSTVTLTISVSAIALPDITYSPNTLTGTAGTPITALTPTNTGGAATWTVSPALPTGLTINSSTGVISGTPTASATVATYTITATNLRGSDTFQISITINPAPVAGGGAGAPPKVTALYFKVVDPNDSTKIYSKTACVAVYSRDLTPRFLASGCSDASGNVNLLAADAKVTIKVYDLGSGDKTRDYLGTIGSDVFDVEGSSYFPGTTRWIVSVPKAQVTPTPTPTPTPSPTPTPTPTATPTPSPSPTTETKPDLGPINSNSNLKPGQVSVLVNGAVVTATVSPNSTNNGLVIKGTGFQLEVSALDAKGDPRALSSTGGIVAELGNRLRVNGTNYLTNSEVRVYVFANLILLETDTTNGSGSFTKSFLIPETIKVGEHTIQVNGQAENKQLRSVSLGFTLRDKEVAPKPSPSPTKPSSANAKKLEGVIGFSFAKFKVGKKQQSVINGLDLSGKKLRVNLVGYAQKSGTRDDLRISLDRALEVRKAILKVAPKAKVTIFGGGTKVAGKCKAFENRCVIANVVKG